VLLSEEKSAEAAGKLAVLEKTNDGFEVAEADWDLRGPGDLLGTAQSGLPALKLGDLKKDAPIMRQARAAVTALLERDPGLNSPQNQRFRRLIVEEHGRTFSNVS
jgi:ATP-dependent DNA helicase RecG